MYPEKYIVDEQSRLYGRVRNGGRENVCFDHLQRDQVSGGGVLEWLVSLLFLWHFDLFCLLLQNENVECSIESSNSLILIS